MGIDAVELRRLTLPMVSPFRSGAVDLHERDLLLVRVVVDGIDGWGECAALPTVGYTLDDAATLAALDDFDLLLIEQPLGVADLDGHAELTALLSTPVCLDESIHSLATLDIALMKHACDIVCIKPGLLGGIAEG